MFKWRSHERSKISAIFKLQFHITQVAEYGGSGLVISVVPAENGKPTAKLEKCVIKESNCYWENPIYETVKFILDPKSGKILDRIYYFLISTGSGKASLVGEFCVNIAEYIGATKACSVSFPFKNSASDTQLHVLIQRIHENGSDQRKFEEIEALKLAPDDRTLRRYFSNGDVEDGVKTTVDDEPLRKASSLQPTLHGVRRGSSGSDVTLSSTDSSSGLSPRDVGVLNNNSSKNQEQQRTQWELAIVPINDSNSVYSLNSPREAFLSETSHMGSDDSVERLKADLLALSRRAEVSELELQTLRKQIVKESKKGQDMLREITVLKEEKNALNDECEKLKAYRKRSDDFKVKSKFQFEGDPWTFLEEIKEELNYEKEINANLRVQLQKTQESNSELLFAVQDLEEMLEKNNRANSHSHSHVSNRVASGESAEEIEESLQKSQSDDDEEQKALEELVRQHSGAQETYLLEQKVMDLCSEIEMYRRDKDELEMQMEQLALDYEILKQENHEYCSKLDQNHIQDQLTMQCEGSSNSYEAMKELESLREKLEGELTEKSEKLSQSLGKIKDLETRNVSLTQEIQRQADVFRADIDAVTRSKIAQEKRASQAEDALTRCDAIINELETQIEELESERAKNLEELSDLEKQNEGYEASMEALVQAKMDQEQRAVQAENAVTECHTTIDELEGNIKNLENELKKHSEESSGSLVKIKELEEHIRNLEAEMEKHVESFEFDLEVVTRAKVDEEQRAIRAEEALRLVRWKNANTAARIQDEFKRLSSQMQSSFDANEKLASKALTEASELRMHNRHLQDLLKKANDEVQSAKHDYEKLADEVQTKSSAVETELKSEIKSLRSELEQLKTRVIEKDELLRREEAERDHLKDVGGKSMEEVMNLQCEVDELKGQCDKLKHSLYEDESEKERLRKQVFQLQADLKKKDEIVSSMEKKSKEINNGVARPNKEVVTKEVVTLKERVKLLEGQIKLKETSFETSATAFLAKERTLQSKIEELETKLGRLEVTLCLDNEINEEIKVSVETNDSRSENDSGDPQKKMDILLKEMVVLKERNNSMEDELKEMQERYSEISLKFAEVEGERQQLVMKLRNMKNKKNRD